MKLKGYERKIALSALLYMLSISTSKDSRVGVLTMCDWTDCTKPTVLKKLKEWESMGYIVRVEKNQRTNCIRKGSCGTS